MKRFSVLITIRIIFLTAFLFSFFDVFINKNDDKIYKIIAMVLMFIGLVIAITFGKQLEQEKIESEERKRTK